MKIITENEDGPFPDGLILYKRVFDENEASILFDKIDALEWQDALSRKVQHYGYKYDYTIKEPQTRKLIRGPDAPRILSCLADAFERTNLLTEYPNQIIVNKYLPGEGIGAHRDHYPIFGDSVGTISLGSGIEMEFKPYGKYKDELPDTVLKVYLEPGDILVFKGDARMKYSHEIKKRKSDLVNGKKISRGVRISLTFRHVNKQYRHD